MVSSSILLLILWYLLLLEWYQWYLLLFEWYWNVILRHNNSYGITIVSTIGTTC